MYIIVPTVAMPMFNEVTRVKLLLILLLSSVMLYNSAFFNYVGANNTSSRMDSIKF